MGKKSQSTYLKISECVSKGINDRGRESEKDRERENDLEELKEAGIRS